MLVCSLAQAQENVDPGFWMENGDWWSTEDARKGDLKEMQGLFDRVVMEPANSDRVDEQAKFISSRMVRRTKGEAVKPRYCLRDFRHTAPEGGELYATTPSAAAVKVALAITSWRLKLEPEIVIVFGDVAQAFPYAPIDEKVQTRIAADLDGLVVRLQSGKEHTLRGGDLMWVLRALYGYRRSPRLWQDWMSAVLVNDVGFYRSVVEPSVFWHHQRLVILVMHVDDLLIAGQQIEVTWCFESIAKHMILKKVGSLIAPGDETIYLGKKIRRTETGFELETNPALIKSYIEACGVTGGRGVDTPSVKYDQRQEAEAEELNAEQHTAFRSRLGKLLMIAADRIDVQFTANKISRHAARPTTLDEWRLKHVARYLCDMDVYH